MTHDPLCYRKHDQVLGRDPFCQCAALRACEQRVFAFHPEWTADICEPDCAPCRRLTELINERQDGYKEGLDAAREAILGAKAIDVYYGRGLDEPPQFIWLNNALAAIDVLREDRQ